MVTLLLAALHAPSHAQATDPLRPSVELDDSARIVDDAGSTELVEPGIDALFAGRHGGHRPSWSDAWYRGAKGELKLWSAALSQEEIEALWRRETP